MSIRFIGIVLPFIFISVQLFAQVDIIPKPASIAFGKTTSLFPTHVSITGDANSERAISYLQEQLLQSKGITSFKTAAKEAKIQFTTQGNLADEAYRLNISDSKIEIKAKHYAGFVNGISSLLQVLAIGERKGNAYVIQTLSIEDKPQFFWRGFMLDESRHFFGKAKVKQLLDWMAFYKLNKFHWHLTDESAWRLEIKKYPLLTLFGGVGSLSNPFAAAQYYTQEEIVEIIQYAERRNIEVIPEVDMPGHATAANRAYPLLSGGGNEKHPDFTFHPAKASTYTFLTNVLKETKALFPSSFMHIGGDEVAFGSDAWNNDPLIQQLKVKEDLKDNKAVENYFMRRMADSIAQFQGNIIVWDEMANANLAKENTIMMWWRHDKPEQLKLVLDKGYKTILTPRLPMYSDFVQDEKHRYGRRWGKDFNTLKNVYDFADGRLDSLGDRKKQVLGIQGNLWTETVINANRLDYLVFPRLAALAEAAWTRGEHRNFESFLAILKKHLPLYRDAQLYYFDPFNNQNPEPVNLRQSAPKYIDNPK